MWILNKPSLQQAINDLPSVINESNGQLNLFDKNLLTKVYTSYDQQNGKINNSSFPSLANQKQDVLYDLYNKTYEEKGLYFIRKELMQSVFRCPICGIGEPAQLDHFYARSNYKALSVCRLNLIPECSVCNQHKSAQSAILFLHPYYNPSLDKNVFFSIKIRSRNKILSWIFKINETNLTNSEKEQIIHQIKQVNLYKRLYKATTNLLAEILATKTNWTTIQVLYKILYNQYQTALNSRGLNDWQTAFYKSLCEAIDSGILTIDEIKTFLLRNTYKYNIKIK